MHRLLVEEASLAEKASLTEEASHRPLTVLVTNTQKTQSAFSATEQERAEKAASQLISDSQRQTVQTILVQFDFLWRLAEGNGTPPAFRLRALDELRPNRANVWLKRLLRESSVCEGDTHGQTASLATVSLGSSLNDNSDSV